MVPFQYENEKWQITVFAPAVVVGSAKVAEKKSRPPLGIINELLECLKIDDILLHSNERTLVERKNKAFPNARIDEQRPGAKYRNIQIQNERGTNKTYAALTIDAAGQLLEHFKLKHCPFLTYLKKGLRESYKTYNEDKQTIDICKIRYR